jgi:hypothetical protein
MMLSCNSGDQFKSRGPIVLGDSSMIVTETDSQYLGDIISDYAPVLAAATPAPTPVAQSAPNPVDTQAAETPPLATNNAETEGLTVDFDEISVFIPDIQTKTFSNSKINKKAAAYMLTEGTLAGNKLQFSGSGKVTRVTQRYETVLAINGKSGQLILEGLARTTNWNTLKLNNGEVLLTNLDAKNLQYLKVTQARIRTEVTKTVKAKKLGRQDQQDYLNAVSKVRSANQKPMSVVLRYVIWQITGTDQNGKSFTKELRIDLSV